MVALLNARDDLHDWARETFARIVTLDADFHVFRRDGRHALHLIVPD